MGGTGTVAYLVWFVFFIFTQKFQIFRISFLMVHVSHGHLSYSILLSSVQVSDLEILSGGIIKLQVSEAEVNNISIRFLDRKT